MAEEPKESKTLLIVAIIFFMVVCLGAAAYLLYLIAQLGWQENGFLGAIISLGIFIATIYYFFWALKNSHNIADFIGYIIVYFVALVIFFSIVRH